MMLNIINYERGIDMSNYLPIGLIVGVILFLISYNTIWENKFSIIYIDQFDNFINYTNIIELGRILYTDSYYYFLIASFILLVAMLGAIILVKENKKDKKNQNIYNQISRELW
jgi:NADH:ubiquinone oxidoreductase subunit 6 (subunit J)